MKKKFKFEHLTFQREKSYRGDDLVNVYVKEGKYLMRVTTIYPEEMSKKKLDFYNDKDVIKFKKTYR